MQRERITFALLYWGFVSIVRVTLWAGYFHLSLVDIVISMYWYVIGRVFDCLAWPRTVVTAFPLRVCWVTHSTSLDWCRLFSTAPLGSISLTMSLSFIALYQFVTDTIHFVSIKWLMPLTVCLNSLKAMILFVFTLSKCSHTTMSLFLSSFTSPLFIFTFPLSIFTSPLSIFTSPE